LMLRHIAGKSHYATGMTPFQEGSVRGYLHRPERGTGRGMVLTHGAGANCKAPLLVEVATRLSEAGITVLRCDLPFRQKRAFGPPAPATAGQDRQGLRDALSALRRITDGPIILGGHSYGGRQATMLAAEDPGVCDALLLLSYPLHPPEKPDQMRTAHFPALQTPALFIHGSKDPFGTPDEMREALKLIPARTKLVMIDGAGHDLKKGKFDGSVLLEMP
jgi:predicted alpha/beta-hydrolase family hydrolase